MKQPPLEKAKRIATEGMTFGIPVGCGLFPPRDVLNAFFACGYDDLPGEDVLEWEPFSLSRREFDALLAWWRSCHPRARVDRLGVPPGDYSHWFGRAVDRSERTHRP